MDGRKGCVLNRIVEFRQVGIVIHLNLAGWCRFLVRAPSTADAADVADFLNLLSLVDVLAGDVDLSAARDEIHDVTRARFNALSAAGAVLVHHLRQTVGAHHHRIERARRHAIAEPGAAPVAGLVTVPDLVRADTGLKALVLETVRAFVRRTLTTDDRDLRLRCLDSRAHDLGDLRADVIAGNRAVRGSQSSADDLNRHLTATRFPARSAVRAR